MPTRKRLPEPAARAWAVLQGLSGRPVAEICGEHDIGEAEYGRWREQFFAEHASGLSAALAARPRNGSGELPALFSVPGKREEALRIAQEMIEILPVPVFFKGRDGKYLGVNKAWEDLFGVPRASFVGKEVHDLYPQSPAVADKHYAMDQQLWANPGSQSYEIPVVTRHGLTRHTLYYKATFTDASGQVAL